MKYQEKSSIILSEIGNAIHNGEINNSDLVHIIELCGTYLNPLTIAEFARQNGMSYNGARKKHKTTIFCVKFIINNE